MNVFTMTSIQNCALVLLVLIASVTSPDAFSHQDLSSLGNQFDEAALRVMNSHDNFQELKRWQVINSQKVRNREGKRP